MIRVTLLLVAVAAFGCSKPSEEDCRKAIANMQRLMGTENLREAATIEGDVRRCRGGSSRKAVQCAIKAETLDDLRHCDFYKVPDNAPGVGTPGAGSAAGSATGSAMGSAAGSATGSAAGSATDSATDPATGSAADPATGSAAGSAADPATGSAAGSATEPAPGSAAGSAS